LTPLKGADTPFTPDGIASGNIPEAFSPVLHDPDMQDPGGALPASAQPGFPEAGMPVPGDTLAASAPPTSPALHVPGMPPADPLPVFALPIILASSIPIGLAGDGSGQNLPVSSIAAAPIPEPATMSLVALGLLGLSWMSRKKWVRLARK